MKKEIMKAVMDRIRQEISALRWIDADEGHWTSRTAVRP